MKKNYDTPVFENVELSEVICAEVNVSQWQNLDTDED